MDMFSREFMDDTVPELEMEDETPNGDISACAGVSPEKIDINMVTLSQPSVKMSAKLEGAKKSARTSKFCFLVLRYLLEGNCRIYLLLCAVLNKKEFIFIFVCVCTRYFFALLSTGIPHISSIWTTSNHICVCGPIM